MRGQPRGCHELHHDSGIPVSRKRDRNSLLRKKTSAPVSTSFACWLRAPFSAYTPTWRRQSLSAVRPRWRVYVSERDRNLAVLPMASVATSLGLIHTPDVNTAPTTLAGRTRLSAGPPPMAVFPSPEARQTAQECVANGACTNQPRLLGPYSPERVYTHAALVNSPPTIAVFRHWRARRNWLGARCQCRLCRPV
jgi:hypothetical protein